VSLNPADPRPPYQQVADRLRAAIAERELAPGDVMPSVRGVAAQYGVSSATASRALDLLKAEGLVDARPGRGNVVRSNGLVLYVASYLSAEGDGARQPWHAQLGDRGLKATYEITEVATVPAPSEVAELLKVAPGTMTVVRRRVLRIDGTPVQLTDSYYPAVLARDTELSSPGKTPGNSPEALERLGIRLGRFRDDLHVRMPTPEEALQLHLGKGIPVVRLLRTTYAADGTPVEVTNQILASDHYVLSYEVPAHQKARDPDGT
jgi:GntR family transcriptional regulator